MDRLINLLRREPVRARLYAIGAAVVAALIVYGVHDSEQAAVWLGVGSAILGVVGTESARKRVKPVRRRD